MGIVSPYFDDIYLCNDCRTGGQTPSEDGPVSTTYDPDDYGPSYDDLNQY